MSNDSVISDLLAAREVTYGAFREVAALSQQLKDLLSTCQVSAVQAESIDMIASKLARIINGDPDHVDSWKDIAGYAMLVVAELEAVTAPVPEAVSVIVSATAMEAQQNSKQPVVTTATTEVTAEGILPMSDAPVISPDTPESRRLASLAAASNIGIASTS